MTVRPPARGTIPGTTPYEYLPRLVSSKAIVVGTVSGLIALLVFIVIMLLVAQHLTQTVDLVVLHDFATIDTPLGFRFALALGVLGQNGIAIAVLFLALVFAVRRCWNVLVVLIVIFVGAEVLDNLFKAIVARPRPTPLPSLLPMQAYSFPSGHALASTAFFLFLAYLGWQLLDTWKSIVWSVALAFLVLAISISRLYLGVHYLSDIVAGAALGFFWTDVVVLGQQMLARRRCHVLVDTAPPET